ncbi:YjgB family protein [Paenibacillus qinlingensis]|uniref:YjgB family protein n=1 Tax=Paenibacillus qinlingensis TaxID=1837343 RepID=UPI0015656D84|nr:YjgB family protein [Paenibacillus qinlingensis]NQX57292.1 YjgB family protein [Paenibacillus qinlingensis]
MKTYKRKTTIYTLILSTMLLATACSSTQEGASNTTTPSPSSSPSATPATTSVASPTASPTSNPSVAPTASPVPSSSTSTSTVSKQIKDMFELAKSGKVSGIPFAANTSLTDDVEKSWGKADKTESAGSGIYATYSKKNAVIGFNKGSQIIDLRSNDAKLHTLTLSQIEQALGKPTDTKVNGDDTIYIYKASQEFQLKFIIPKSTGKVDHISVFDTIHSINNMAG